MNGQVFVMYYSKFDKDQDLRIVPDGQTRCIFIHYENLLMQYRDFFQLKKKKKKKGKFHQTYLIENKPKQVIKIITDS